MNHHRGRLIWRFGTLPIAQPGRYLFRINFRLDGEDEWRQVASVPLEVIFEAPEDKTAEIKMAETEAV